MFGPVQVNNHRITGVLKLVHQILHLNNVFIENELYFINGAFDDDMLMLKLQ